MSAHLLNDPPAPGHRRTTLFLDLICAALFAGLTSCTKPDQPAKLESSPGKQATASAAGQPKPVEAPDPSPPTPDEVQNALARVYQDAVSTADPEHPRFIAGDFNGDGLQDLAVLVRPAAEMLPGINSELANWSIEDPRRVPTLDPRKVVQPLPPKPEPVRVRRGDVLLAVIHGYGAGGWRSPEARQSYLLKGGVWGAIEVVPRKEALKVMRGQGRPPDLKGDAIRGRVGGGAGWIYWTGANYAWYH